ACVQTEATGPPPYFSGTRCSSSLSQLRTKPLRKLRHFGVLTPECGVYRPVLRTRAGERLFHQISRTTSPRKHEVCSHEFGRHHALLLAGFIVEAVMDATKDTTVCLLLRQIPEARVITSFSGQAHCSRIDDGKRNVVPTESNLQRARRSSRQACGVAGVRRI